MTRVSACWRSASALKEMFCGASAIAEDHARILHREESFRHDHVEEQREHERSHRDQQGDRLMPQDKLQSAAIERNYPIVEILGRL